MTDLNWKKFWKRWDKIASFPCDINARGKKVALLTEGWKKFKKDFCAELLEEEKKAEKEWKDTCKKHYDRRKNKRPSREWQIRISERVLTLREIRKTIEETK